MSDYGTMQARIADEISDDALTSQIQKAIQSAIKHYERTRFYFNQKVASTFTALAGQEYYDGTDLADIPNLIEIDAASYQLGSSWLPIDAVPFETIENCQTGQVVGPPQFLAYYAEQIRLYAIPNQSYPIRMAYHYRLAALVDDTETNAWMTDAEELIRQRAKYILGIDVTREIPLNAPPSSLEVDALRALKAETRKRMQRTPLRSEVAAIAGRRSFNILTGD